MVEHHSDSGLPTSTPQSNSIYNGARCAPASFNEDYVAAARHMNPYFVRRLTALISQALRREAIGTIAVLA